MTYIQAITILEYIKGAPLQHGDKFPKGSGGNLVIGKGVDGLFRGWNFAEGMEEEPLWVAREGWELDERIYFIEGFKEAKDAIDNGPYWLLLGASKKGGKAMSEGTHVAIGATIGGYAGMWICAAMLHAIPMGRHWWLIPSLLTICALFAAFIWLGAAVGLAKYDIALRSKEEEV